MGFWRFSQLICLCSLCACLSKKLHKTNIKLGRRGSCLGLTLSHCCLKMQCNASTYGALFPESPQTYRRVFPTPILSFVPFVPPIVQLKSVAGPAGWMALPRGHFWPLLTACGGAPTHQPPILPTYSVVHQDFAPEVYTTLLHVSYTKADSAVCAPFLVMVCSTQSVLHSFGAVFSMEWTLTNRFGPWWYLPPSSSLALLPLLNHLDICLCLIFAIICSLPLPTSHHFLLP